MDAASRYKASEPIRNKEAITVATAFKKIYRAGPLKFPKVLNTDGGPEFKGLVVSEMRRKKVRMRVAEPGFHRPQSLVENYNKLLARRL